MFYAAGMVANDVADREVDRVGKPHRPIPSGEVSVQEAAGLATALFAVGLAAAASSAGVALCAVVLAYDFLTKRSRVLGAANMAAARAGNVLLGAFAAGGAIPWAAAGGMFAHVFALTMASAFEDRAAGTGGELRAMKWAHLAVVVGIGGVVGGAAGLAPLGVLAWMLWTAYGKGDPGGIVRAGVLGVILVDAAFLMGAGHLVAGGIVMTLLAGPKALGRAIAISGRKKE